MTLCWRGICCRPVSIRPSVCLSVCPFVRHKPVLCQNDWTNRADFWQWHRGFFLPITHSVIRKFGYLQKIVYFPLELFPQLRTRKNFAPASRSRCQQNSSSSSSTVEFIDDTIDASWLFTASLSTVTLQLCYFDLSWICCTTCFYS